MKEERATKLFTRGGHLSFHDLRMFFQIHNHLLQIFIVMALTLTLALTLFYTPKEHFRLVANYQYAKFVFSLGGNGKMTLFVEGHNHELPLKTIVNHPYFQTINNAFYQHLINSVWQGTILSFILTLGLIVYFVIKGQKKTDDVYIRGNTLGSVKEVKKLMITNKEASHLHLDGLPLIKDSEVQHMLVHGTLGMGKSQLIMTLLDQLRARGDRVIIYDSGCSFTRAYFDESNDVLLNPYDKRCANWDLWLESPNESDLENLAHSLIPIEGESQPFFVHAARAVFSASASKMRHDADCSLEKLLQFLLTNEFEQMEPYLAGTSAATLMSDKVEKMAISVRAMITTYVRSLQALYGLAESGKKPFSIRNYILDEQAKGWLFISSNGEKHHSLKPLMSMWLSIASLALLSLPEDLNRRIWFICDELPSLHQLPFLGTTLAQVRKFGGCFVLGVQNYFQLSQVYGDTGAKAMFDLLNTRFFFRNPSADVAEFVSKELCNEDLEEIKESTSYGANSVRDGISLSKQRSLRPLVDYSEIMKLNILTCFVRLPGDYPVIKHKLTLKKRPELTPGFIEREIPVIQKRTDWLAVKKPSAQSSTSEDSTTNPVTPITIHKKNLDVEFYV